MKKLLKLIAVCLIATMAFSFTACAPKAKTFTKLEMSIELNSSFAEKTIISQTAYYESKNVIVTALREEFSLLEGVENWSLTEYGEACVSANGLTGVSVSLSENGKYSYFVYEKEVNGVKYSYLATCHKTSEAFWLIQFATFSNKYEKEKEQFYKYIDSIQFAN